ncbi:hypothetical protein KAR91_80915 [Candidatus Pacearchaeota archaeon]|nr:hypothetical protein [Candidatus Pacearchaeota archaeon]
MKATFHNCKKLSKDNTKGMDLTKCSVRLYEMIIYWAITKKNTKKTICVDGRSLRSLKSLEANGLIKIQMDGWQYYTAELLNVSI